MATYGLKYTQYISKGGTTLRINVYAKGWSGTTYGMAHITGASLQLIGGQSDITAPIIKTSFSWSMVDAWDQGSTRSDGTSCVNAAGEKCGRWEEFYTNDATKFRVEILKGSAVIWKGYVTPDSWSEEMQYRGSVTITARDMLGTLQDSEFNLTGRVTALQVVQGAMTACGCPMTLAHTSAHFLVNENGQSILSHDFAASTFAGRTWFQALEDTLDSLGLVIRYNGAGQLVLTSLRYLSADTLQGHHAVAYVSRSGLRQLDPALKYVTETFDLKRESYIPKDPDAGQFTATGGTITCSMTVTRPGARPETATGVVKAYNLTRTGSEGWSGTLGIPMYGTAESGAVIRGIYFPCNAQDASNTLEAVYSNTKLDRPFRFTLTLDGGLMKVTNGGTANAVFNAPLASSFIYIRDIYIRVQCTAGGTRHYLNSEGVWVTDVTYRSIQLGESITVPILNNGSNYQVVIKSVSVSGTGRPVAPLVAPLLLDVAPDDNSTSPTEFKTTTNYDQENNVTITRSPVIGSADVAECPEFISNALCYNDVVAADRWNWPGQSSYYPLAVMIQAQILCFHAAAASVFTGDALDSAADIALPGYAFDYFNRRGVPVSGVYDICRGIASQTIVREVYSWEEVWGSFNPEYTRVTSSVRGGTSATSSGGSSSGGGSGGGSYNDPRLVRNDGADNAVKTIVVVTAYPATPDPNTLYILVNS